MPMTMSTPICVSVSASIVSNVKVTYRVSDSDSIHADGSFKFGVNVVSIVSVSRNLSL